VPGGEKAGERLFVHRLDLLAEGGETRPAHAPQHVRLAPLAFGAAGAKLTADEPAVALE